MAKQIAPAIKALAAELLETARNAPKHMWFGDRKVFLCAICDMSDPAEVACLDDFRRCGALEFARADLVAAMDPALVAASEWRLQGAQFHFIVVA